MKSFKVILIAILSMLAIASVGAAKPKVLSKPIFMGEVLEVEEADKYGNIRILVKGYIRNCSVYEEEIYGIISKDTKVITDGCKKGTDNEKLNIEVGDTVYLQLSNVMTLSIPPQSSVEKILLTKKGK